MRQLLSVKGSVSYEYFHCLCHKCGQSFGPQVEPYHRQFDLALLFERTIFSTGPFTLFILFFSFRLAQLYRVNRKTLPNSLWGMKVVIEVPSIQQVISLIEIQIVLSIFLCIHIAILVLWAISADQRTLVSMPAAPLSVVAATGLLGLLSLENNRSIRRPLLICTHVLISMLVDVAQTRTLWLRRDNRALSSLFTCSIIVKFIASASKHSRSDLS